jgi:hypothetical protein
MHIIYKANKLLPQKLDDYGFNDKDHTNIFKGRQITANGGKEMQ